MALRAFAATQHQQQQHLQLLLPDLHMQLTHLRDLYASPHIDPTPAHPVPVQRVPVQRVSILPIMPPLQRVPPVTVTATVPVTGPATSPATATVAATDTDTATATNTATGTASSPASPPATQPRHSTRPRKPNPVYSLSSSQVVYFQKDPAAHMSGAFGNLIRDRQQIKAMLALNANVQPPVAPPKPSLRPPTYAALRAGPVGEAWEIALEEEFARLHDSGTAKFVAWSTKPSDKNSSYMHLVNKKKIDSKGKFTFRVRATVADTHSDYSGPTAAYTASLPTFKLLLNSAVSSPGCKIATADNSNNY